MLRWLQSRDLFADEGRCVYVRTARCGEGGVSAAARQGDVGAAGGRKHETAVPDGPVDTCGARGMDGQRFPASKRFVNVMSVPLAEMFVSTGQERGRRWVHAGR